jgi:exodeoxyribonuclease VII small subunit
VNEDVATMDYETAVAALQQTVEQLGHGQEDLAESVQAYERGLLLARHCSQLLRDAERRLERERPPTP